MKTIFIELHRYPGSEPVSLNPAAIAAFYPAPDNRCYVDLIGHSENATIILTEPYEAVTRAIDWSNGEQP